MKTLHQLSNEIGALFSGPDMPLPSICIDSRAIQAGDLFVAIKGKHHDGHDHIMHAISSGARAVLTEKPVDAPSVSVIQVKDTVKALGNLAHRWRQQFDIPVIALTGSCGKTTTKGMIQCILSAAGETLATEGNKNNFIGLPMTLLRLRPEHQFAVIEMGTNFPGEIDYLASLTQPTTALITNIGASHLEGLGSFEGVSNEKSDIFKHVSIDGAAVISLDEPFASEWKGKIGKRRQITYSMHHPADVRVSQVVTDHEGTKALLSTPHGAVDLHCPLLGDHIIKNMLAAAAASYAIGVSLEHTQQGVSQVQVSKGRFKPHYLVSGALVIDDTYNASAGAVESAIKTLSNWSGEKIFVMSNFGEMGNFADQFHRQLGEWAAHYQLDQLFLYGDAKLLSLAQEAFPTARIFQDKAHLAEAVKQVMSPQAKVVIKGTRANRMEDVLHVILAEEVTC